MRKGRMAATRFFIIVIVLMTFFVLSGPTVLARQGPPQVPPGKDTLEDKKEDKNKGWDKVVEKFIENGITPPAHVNNGFFDYVNETFEIDEELIPMVMVGELGVEYIIPTGLALNPGETDDMWRATVLGGYKIATYETTYDLWYEVRIWAEENGYIFKNKGREGSHGVIGDIPSENKAEPVTTISWQDVIIWSNSISEMHGYSPVYLSSSGDILRDAYHYEAYSPIKANHNGYRLPSHHEWEMAAKWKEDIESTDGSIYVEGRYWTPGSYASGATNNVYDTSATDVVAWFYYSNHYLNNLRKTMIVGMKMPNHLGIYDMTGNVSEFVFIPDAWQHYHVKGGHYESNGYSLMIGSIYRDYPPSGYNSMSSGLGFRLIRNP